MDKFPAKSNAFASYFAVIPSEVELSGLGSRDIDGKAGGYANGSERIKSRYQTHRSLRGILRVRCASLRMTVMTKRQAERVPYNQGRGNGGVFFS
jgi:hypothetical protein